MEALMKITDELINRVHQIANENLYKLFPLHDMAELSKHPEGHIKRWEVRLVLEALNKEMITRRRM